MNMKSPIHKHYVIISNTKSEIEMHHSHMLLADEQANTA